MVCQDVPNLAICKERKLPAVAVSSSTAIFVSLTLMGTSNLETEVHLFVTELTSSNRNDFTELFDCYTFLRQTFSW